MQQSQGEGAEPRRDGENLSFARQRVRQALRSAIALRTMVPGQQVPEVELATSLGISRTPVREALRELEQEGLVVSYPHRGTFIRTLTPKDLENLIYLRAAVEGMAAWQAVEHASRAQIRALEHILDEMAASDPHGGEVAQAAAAPARVLDLQFHEAMVALSGNEELSRVWQRVDPLLRTIQAHDLQPGEPTPAAYVARLVDRHRQVVAALLSGDAAQAEQAARTHVIDTGLRISADMRRLEAARTPGGNVRDLAGYRKT